MTATTMSIVALIPGRTGATLERLRRRIDPDAADARPARIPIVAPFRAEPSFLPLEHHCWQVGHGTAPFEVALGPPTIDDHGVVRAELASGAEEFRALREALITGRYAPPGGDAPYEPVAVVAELRRAGDVEPARRELAGVDASAPFVIERFELMAQYPDGGWYQRDFYTLDKAVTRA